MWICTATGSSAAMHSAGGDPMDPYSTQLQYKIREPLLDSNFFDQNNLNIELDYQEKEDESVELFTNMGHGFLGNAI